MTEDFCVAAHGLFTLGEKNEGYKHMLSEISTFDNYFGSWTTEDRTNSEQVETQQAPLAAFSAESPSQPPSRRSPLLVGMGAVRHCAKKMKTPLTALTISISFVVGAFAETEWTYQVKEGEDATSTHYYFYESNGDSIQRVRWVWNGGAQNLPTVTEYLLGSGKITIRHLVGKREDVANLILGREAKLELKNEYSLTTRSTAEMLIPTAPAKSLSDTQRIDLKNLIDLMAKERTPYKTKGQQAGEPNL